MRLRCATHDRVFSEPVDRNFHEALNVGCRWEQVRESEKSRDRIWVAVTTVSVWAALTLLISWFLH